MSYQRRFFTEVWLLQWGLIEIKVIGGGEFSRGEVYKESSKKEG